MHKILLCVREINFVFVFAVGNLEQISLPPLPPLCSALLEAAIYHCVSVCGWGVTVWVCVCVCVCRGSFFLSLFHTHHIRQDNTPHVSPRYQGKWSVCICVYVSLSVLHAKLAQVTKYGRAHIQGKSWDMPTNEQYQKPFLFGLPPHGWKVEMVIELLTQRFGCWLTPEW